MSPPNPCRSCGTALQHCLEMRHDTATYCCAPCAAGPGRHRLAVREPLDPDYQISSRTLAIILLSILALLILGGISWNYLLERYL